MVFQTLTLKPNTYYQMAMDCASESADQALIMDLYSRTGSYDSDGQQLTVELEDISRDFRGAFRIINTGSDLPATVQIRLFSFSRAPIRVRNFRLMELSRYLPPVLNGKTSDAATTGTLVGHVMQRQVTSPHSEPSDASLQSSEEAVPRSPDEDRPILRYPTLALKPSTTYFSRHKVCA